MLHRQTSLWLWRVARVLGCVGLAVGVVLGSSSVARAMWRDADQVGTSPVKRGAVMFAANDEADQTWRHAGASGDSSVGTPVQVTTPGSVIAEVVHGPVLWHFDTVGYALGTAGLDYDVTYSSPHDDTATTANTFLEGSILRVYPAGEGGDCSARPTTAPEQLTGDDGRVTTHQVLQAPGANVAGTEIHQSWCVSITWDGPSPAPHTSVATADAQTKDGTRVSTSDIFTTTIEYPPKLTPHATHHNTATARGTTQSGAVLHTSDRFETALYPDPTHEPDLTITLTPHVTSDHA